MFYLGMDYVVSSTLLLLGVGACAYTFRKPLMKLFYKKATLDLFLSRLRIYLEKTYPDIKFDYSIVEEAHSEPNPEARKYMIADNIVDQFTRIQIDTSKYPTSTPKDLQWSSYLFNCEPNKDKLPKDWLQRKNALAIRDHRKCFRCSKQIDVKTIYPKMIRPLEDGGKYYLENLIPLCVDCDKLLSNDPKKKTGFLTIKDKLYEIVRDS